MDTNRLHSDDRATDTVTNFTTMVEPLKENDIHHVYLITSDYHMRRSRVIGTVVFGSQSAISAMTATT
ncbi:YdcF family protein [Euhalothece natronophila]|uniref:YdcF family protein n=1 Tax=Euhalothece natronophila TaxID=577489 RepID=UPI0036F3A04C